MSINIAMIPGSFDPFTNGHLELCKKAAEMFDQVYIVIAHNSKKQRKYTPEEMKTAIEEELSQQGLSNCHVEICTGLIAVFAKSKGVHYVVRGLRNLVDYSYETQNAEINKSLNPALNYVYLESDCKTISSSLVKELYSYGESVKKYVPVSILKLMHRVSPK